jgi:hypothetical protein
LLRIFELNGSSYKVAFMNKNLLSFIFLFSFLLISNSLFAQPGPAYHPYFADGAKLNVLMSNPPSIFLKWKNPAGATSNEVYCHYDSTLVANLDSSAKISKTVVLANSITVNVPFLHIRMFWRVVEKNASGSTSGPIWTVILKGDTYYIHSALDDLEFGMGKWDVSGSLNNKWKLDNKANFQLSEGAYNKVLSSQSTQHGTRNISYAAFRYIPPQIYLYQYTFSFASDILISGSDSVSLQISTNEGASWFTQYKWTSSERNADKKVYWNSNFSMFPSVLIRFKADFRDTASKCAFDRFSVAVWTGVLTMFMPVIINAQEIPGHFVSLTIDFVSMASPNLYVYKKKGLPSSPGDYYLWKNVGYSSPPMTVIDSSTTDSIYTYSASHSPTPQSDEVTVYLTGVTPVELSSFNISAEGTYARLNWITSTETNNMGFEVQRSDDNNKWSKIGFIIGNGTTTEEKYYTYIDRQPSTGNVFYRLKQIDYDGTFAFSKTVQFSSAVITSYSLEQNYPNPFNPSTSFSYSIPESGFVSLKIFDLLGREIKSLVNEVKNAGSYSITFDADGLPSGTYIYQLKANSYNAAKKFVLLK